MKPAATSVCTEYSKAPATLKLLASAFEERIIELAVQPLEQSVGLEQGPGHGGLGVGDGAFDGPHQSVIADRKRNAGARDTAFGIAVESAPQLRAAREIEIALVAQAQKRIGGGLKADFPIVEQRAQSVVGTDLSAEARVLRLNDQAHAARLLAGGKRTFERDPRQRAGQQQRAFDFCEFEMAPADKGLQPRRDGTGHSVWNLTEVQAFDEAVDQFEMEFAAVAQLLRRNDKTDEDITFFGVETFDSRGEFVELCDRDGHAAQIRDGFLRASRHIGKAAIHDHRTQNDMQIFCAGRRLDGRRASDVDGGWRRVAGWCDALRRHLTG